MTSLLWYDLSDAAIGIIIALAGGVTGYALRGLVGHWQANAIEKQASLRLDETEAEIRARLKEAEIAARTELVRARETLEQEAKAKAKDHAAVDERQNQREDNLDKRAELIDRQSAELAAKREALAAQSQTLDRREHQLDERQRSLEDQTTQLAGLTREEARRQVQTQAETLFRAEAGQLIRKLQREAHETAEREARKLVLAAAQRFAIAQAPETLATTVQVPTEEAKGRIIGREGRNVRTLENLTGTTIIIDDTPGTVTISCFDPIRRETARRALEHLIADGRIHIARIEESVEQARKELEADIQTAGEHACYEARVQGLPPTLVQTLGRLKYRTSYAQNVLQHSIEVAGLMGLMAAELDLDDAIARRIGLLHDIGKALDHEQQGSHAKIGADLLAQSGEPPLVANAVAAHHGAIEGTSLYAPLCVTADALSSARPGARREATTCFIQRLEKLEQLVQTFPGIQKTFALQAGREVRVFVKPEEVDDTQAQLLARDIARKIEQELQYPGEIRVVVSREQRYIQFAQ
ncbi:MAG: ribonuclease Y [Kiritimatiellia bacterium]